jgi:hypothetical protein
VTIYGEVTSGQFGVKDRNAEAAGGTPSFQLAIEGEKGRQEIRTDELGRYRLEGLSPGTYQVTILLPDELTTNQPTSKITIADGGCAAVNFFVTQNGRVSGRVLAPDDQPVGKVLIALYNAESQSTEREYTKLEETNPDGSYSFTAVPQGRYLVVVGVTSYSLADDPTNAYPRTYYPGVGDASQATIVSVGAGEKLIDHDLRLLPRRVARALHVRVVWGDGTPVANAGLSFRDVSSSVSGTSTGGTTDYRGRFTINAYEGQILVIEARSNRPYPNNLLRGELIERTAPVRITVGNQAEQAKIVIIKLH